jgi:hypothetical protein
MDYDLFTICKCNYDDIYFIEPTKKYFELYSRKFIDELNKYSYGYKDKFAMCRIYMEKNKLYVSHFNNYVREFYILNKKKFDDIMFKGIGKLLLKNILSYLLIKQEINVHTKIYLEMVNTKNKKLVQFYQSLSFVLLDEDNFSSRVGDILKKLQDLPSIHVHM